jgi:NADPH:quinone reductase-like Zn-dependent oxidoreductase
VVAGKGQRVRRFNVGERVYAVNYAGGFYAEFVATEAEKTARIPAQLDWPQAGAALVPGLTALQGIDDKLRIRRTDTLLIFGATGAVGTLAIQFAKRHRARVLATATGRDATALVRRLGADASFDPRSDNALEKLRSLAPDGIDAVLALAGGKVLDQCLELVRARGRVAYPNGIEPEPKRRSNIRIVTYDAEAGPRQFAQLERAVTQARLRVPIAAKYPLAQAARAHERLEKGHVLGRIVLLISSGR